MQRNAIQYNTMQCNTIQCNATWIYAMTITLVLKKKNYAKHLWILYAAFRCVSDPWISSFSYTLSEKFLSQKTRDLPLTFWQLWSALQFAACCCYWSGWGESAGCFVFCTSRCTSDSHHSQQQWQLCLIATLIHKLLTMLQGWTFWRLNPESTSGL